MATKAGKQSTPPHAADTHDVIRVQGARENNLKGVTIEIPKRRLTVFTGVSGSGKSSLVFGTIAAESQRMINETYSTFLQGFMPNLSRPEVDLLDGLTTAIIVDQERMGANPRSTVGTATDANTMLRILFSRIGTPHIGPPTAFAFNVPTRVASGVMKTDKGGREEKTFVREAVYQGGMCPRCEGMGAVNDFDLTAIYDGTKSLSEGALLVPGYSMDGWYGRIFSGAGLPMDKPVAKFTAKQLDKLLHGRPEKISVDGVNLTYEGVLAKVQKSMLSKDLEAMQPHVRRFVERAVTFTTCPDCHGTRLSKEALSSKINGANIAELCSMQISDLAGWLRDLDEPSVAPLVGGLQHLLDSFAEIGLGYLSLDRPAGTLSGGEAQRTKMIRHLGSSLTDVTYVFDEPTIGLHPHDIARMNQLLVQLRDKGNTVLVVEHKPETIAIADHVIDLGPGAGTAGGTVCFEGSVEGLRTSDTTTGHHLDDRVRLKESVRASTGALQVRGASTHNLQQVDVDIPLGVLCVVTGVAGSGKSSLIHGSVAGRDGVVVVDQGAIRGSRRSNPATYTGLLEPIRKAFAKANGVKPALF
ncbi:MAG: excinuclease ABC subunit UvrA, partial [Pedococcus sp.]